MAQRKPKVEFYWVTVFHKHRTEDGTYAGADTPDQVVNWRLVGANGEIMCSCTQGFRDKADALRNLDACGIALFNADLPAENPFKTRVTGPGKKPS